jgi:hypothetical protein
VGNPIPDAVPGAYVWFIGGNRRHSAPLFPSTLPGKTHWCRAPDIAGTYDVQVFWPGNRNPLGGQKTLSTLPGDEIQFSIQFADDGDNITW